jgi:hypothetical protein
VVPTSSGPDKHRTKHRSIEASSSVGFVRAIPTGLGTKSLDASSAAGMPCKCNEDSAPSGARGTSARATISFYITTTTAAVLIERILAEQGGERLVLPR